MLEKVLALPLSYFHVTPSGQILNRFSKDTSVLDDLFPYACSSFLKVMFLTASQICSILAVFPVFLLGLPPLWLSFRRLTAYFKRSAIELKRLDNVTKSPIYAHFSETLGGITTIRAFGDTERFSEASNVALDKNVQASYLMNCGINRWLMFWTSGAVGTGSIGVAAFLAAATGRASPGLAAMAIKYSMQVSW